MAAERLLIESNPQVVANTAWAFAAVNLPSVLVFFFLCFAFGLKKATMLTSTVVAMRISHVAAVVFGCVVGFVFGLKATMIEPVRWQSCCSLVTRFPPQPPNKRP